MLWAGCNIQETLAEARVLLRDLREKVLLEYKRGKGQDK
jgi:hypothetical protein